MAVGDNQTVIAGFLHGTEDADDSGVHNNFMINKLVDELDVDGSDDVIEGGDGNDLLAGDNSTVIEVSGSHSPSRIIDELTIRGGRDQLDGDAGDDVLYGQQGRDRLNGGPGNDRLFGGSGRDRLNGGAGTNEIEQAGPDEPEEVTERLRQHLDTLFGDLTWESSPWTKSFVVDLACHESNPNRHIRVVIPE